MPFEINTATPYAQTTAEQRLQLLLAFSVHQRGLCAFPGTSGNLVIGITDDEFERQNMGQKDLQMLQIKGQIILDEFKLQINSVSRVAFLGVTELPEAYYLHAMLLKEVEQKARDPQQKNIIVITKHHIDNLKKRHAALLIFFEQHFQNKLTKKIKEIQSQNKNQNNNNNNNNFDDSMPPLTHSGFDQFSSVFDNFDDMDNDLNSKMEGFNISNQPSFNPWSMDSNNSQMRIQIQNEELTSTSDREFTARMKKGEFLLILEKVVCSLYKLFETHSVKNLQDDDLLRIFAAAEMPLVIDDSQTSSSISFSLKYQNLSIDDRRIINRILDNDAKIFSDNFTKPRIIINGLRKLPTHNFSTEIQFNQSNSSFRVILRPFDVEKQDAQIIANYMRMFLSIMGFSHYYNFDEGIKIAPKKSNQQTISANPNPVPKSQEPKPQKSPAERKQQLQLSTANFFQKKGMDVNDLWQSRAGKPEHKQAAFFSAKKTELAKELAAHLQENGFAAKIKPSDKNDGSVDLRVNLTK